MTREPLPNRRASHTIKFRFGGQNAAYHLSVGYFPDGRMGEIFISTNKIGSAAEAIARDIAILISLGLQHHCALDTMAKAITREANGEPSTVAGAVLDILCGDRSTNDGAQ